MKVNILKRGAAALVSVMLLFTAGVVYAASASAATGIAFGSTSCEHRPTDDPSVFYPAFVVSATSDDQSTITVYGGSDPNNLTPYVIPVSTTQIDYPIDLTSLGTGTPFYFMNDVAGPSTALIGPVPDCSYDPSSARVSAVISALTCVAGTWNGSVAVTSTNPVYGEDIDFRADDVTLAGFPTYSDFQSTWDLPFSLPASTTAGSHTFTVINRGVLIHTEPFTVASGCGVVPQATLTATATSALGGKATATNTSSSAISFVVFAFASDGTDVKNTPDPGTTSFTLQPGESVTFPYTIQPLPSGVSEYYLVLLPVVGDLEIARSEMIMFTFPVIYKAPSVTGVARVGYRLTCAGATYSPNVNGVGYEWLRSGVLTSVKQSTYLLSASDYGKRISCRVKATDGVTTVTASSASSAVVALGIAPKVTSRYYPKIIGTPTRGRYITVSLGPWTPKPSYFTCTLNRYVGSKIVRTLGPVKCSSTTKFKVPTKYAKGTKYFFTVRAYKPGYAVGAKNTAVFKSR